MLSYRLDCFRPGIHSGTIFLVSVSLSSGDSIINCEEGSVELQQEQTTQSMATDKEVQDVSHVVRWGQLGRQLLDWCRTSSQTTAAHWVRTLNNTSGKLRPLQGFLDTRLPVVLMSLSPASHPHHHGLFQDIHPLNPPARGKTTCSENTM